MLEESFILRVCDFIARYSIYTLIFLVPLFFLPWTSDVLDFNKQSLLLVLVCMSLFASMLKILASGRLEIKKSAIHMTVGVLFLAHLLATIFSVFGLGSFWGQPQQAHESMVTMICLTFLYLLVSNIFSKKDIFTSVIILSFSAVFAEFVGVLQLLGLFTIPFDFAKSVAFNTVGSSESIGFFAAILLPLAILMLITAKKWWRVLFILQTILSTIVVFLTGYNMIWWVVAAGMAVLTFGMIKNSFIKGGWIALPVFFLAISIFCALLNPQIKGVTQRISEVSLSQKMAFGISMQAVKERPILGSGPGTFGYNFSKFKNADFSKTPLWNVIFNRAPSEILNSLATTGVLGFLALLALVVLSIFYGVKLLILKNSLDGGQGCGQAHNVLLLGLFAVFVGQTVSLFVCSFNISLYFIYFFAIAALAVIYPGVRKEYNLKPSSLSALIVTFSFTLIFIFGAGLLTLNAQRYVAEVNYYDGLSNYQANQKEAGLKKLESAASLNSGSDIYFRQLSQAYIFALQDMVSSSTAAKSAPTDEEKAKIQALVSNSVNAAKIATDINPNDVNNWSFRGYVYQNLFGALSDAPTRAINSYDSALKLDPNSPYLFAQKGNIYLAQALNLPVASFDPKNQFLSQAKDELEKAVALNPNYSNALYSLGIVYEALGQKDKAIGEFTVLQQLNPQNTDISKILDILKAGKTVLQSATPPVENLPSGMVSE